MSENTSIPSLTLTPEADEAAMQRHRPHQRPLP